MKTAKSGTITQIKVVWAPINTGIMEECLITQSGPTVYAAFSWELSLEGVMVVWREDNTLVRQLLHILKDSKIQDESEEELSQKLLLSAHCIPLSHPPSMANQPIWQGNQSPMFNTSRKIKDFNLSLCLKTKRTYCSSLFSLSLIKSEGKIKVLICEKV